MVRYFVSDLQRFLLLDVKLTCSNLQAGIREVQCCLVPGEPEQSRAAADRICDTLDRLESSAERLGVCLAGLPDAVPANRTHDQIGIEKFIANYS